MIGPAAVRRVAAETGVREEAVEKVLYLRAILDRLRVHPDLRNAWVLKGGTAINLFHLSGRLAGRCQVRHVVLAATPPWPADRAGGDRES